MPTLIAALAAFTVAVFAIRGADSISLCFIAAATWAVASVPIIVACFRRPAGFRMERVFGVMGVALVLTASIAVTRWPLRLGPVIYAADFDALADRVVAGHSFDTPQRIGPFTFQKGGVERGYVCLWTDLAPAGRSGFVRGSSDGVLPFNVWSAMKIGSGWHFLIED